MSIDTRFALIACAGLTWPAMTHGAGNVEISEQAAQKFEVDGDYENAKREWSRLLGATTDLTAARATALRQLGWMEYRLGNLSVAQTSLTEAQALFRRLYGDRNLDLARTLNYRGVVRRDLYDYIPAQLDLENALAMLDSQQRRGSDLSGNIHNNLAGLWYYRSDYRKAVQFYHTALEIFESLHGPMHADVGGSLNNLGLMYRELGASREALQYLQRALTIKEKLLGPMHPSVGSTVHNLADLSVSLGEDSLAEQRYARALKIFEQALGSEHPNVAHVLANRGELRTALGQSGPAYADVRRALTIREKFAGAHSSWVAETLIILAPLQSSLGEHPAALTTASRSLSLALLSGENALLSNAYAAYANALDMTGDLETAVFFGKQAVNVIQAMRAQVAQLGQPLQQSFLAKRSGTYRKLADQLIALGRLSEAEQIHTMLREEEYFDYVRNAARTADAGTTRAQFSRREQPATMRLLTMEQTLRSAIVTEKQQANGREGSKQSAQTIPVTAVAVAALNRFEVAARELADDLRSESIAATHRDDTGATAAPLPGVAELTYFLSPRRVRLLVRTTATHRAFERQRDHRSLNTQVFALRQALQSSSSQPLPAAQRLYDELLRPVEDMLASERIHTLRLVLDGTLRYVPFAALHDGKQFLVERYAVEVLTTANTEKSEQVPGAAGHIAAFGVSHAISGLPPLSRVKSELEAIVLRDLNDRDGVLPGTLSMDRDFTQLRLTAAFRERVPLIHLATHFVFRPGALADSYLVLGDSTRLSLERLQSDAPDLSAVRLLTLSACSSALGDDTGAGRELESFGTLAQRLGAQEVLATLWPVADASTAVLMANTYRAKAERNLSTAQALRQAQLTLMERVSPWRHPIHWAPFVVFAVR